MSRSQSTQVFNQSKGNATTDQSDATNSYGQTQSDISDYKNDLSKFMSSNPYTKGGEYDQTVNTGLANASDAGSSSLKASLQDQALRTGQKQRRRCSDGGRRRAREHAGSGERGCDC